MVDHDVDRSDWLTMDGAWLKREIAEQVRQFSAPLAGIAGGSWRGLTSGWRR